MSTKFQRSTLSNSNADERQSLFFRDLTSPISHHRTSRFVAAGAGNHHNSAAFSSWRENLAESDSPPPPPVFTLDDRVEFSPEPALLQEPAQDPKTPSPVRSGNWWSPRRGEEELEGEKGKGSPVDGVVTSSSSRAALVVLPQVKEVAKAEIGRQEGGGRDQGVVVNEEEWVTVYGFSPGDTNLVLREFEKCGEILKHVPGPRDANWMYILYQNRYDAQKALGKNGMQLNSVLIVGVKPVDPVQRQYLNEKLNNTHGGFMTSLPPQFAPGRSSAVPPRPSYQPNARIIIRDGGPRSTGAIASPEKSVLSKVMDLMFGF